PSLFNAFITPSGESALPFTAMQMPFSKSSVTYSGLFGASSGKTESVLKKPRNFLSLASRAGSSRMPASYEMWRRFRSIEYGFEAVKFFLLANVGAEGDHFRIVGFLDPGKQNRSIESAGIS